MKPPTLKVLRAQTSLEFSFSLIVTCVLLLGMIRIMLWAGKDLVHRRQTHESVLTEGTNPASQVRPKFYLITPINAAHRTNIFNPVY